MDFFSLRNLAVLTCTIYRHIALPKMPLLSHIIRCFLWDITILQCRPDQTLHHPTYHEIINIMFRKSAILRVWRPSRELPNSNKCTTDDIFFSHCGRGVWFTAECRSHGHKSVYAKWKLCRIVSGGVGGVLAKQLRRNLL